MVFDHTILSIYFIFSDKWLIAGKEILIKLSEFSDLYTDTSWANPRNFIHPLVLWLFFSISGISSTLSRNNFKRGLQVLFAAMVLTVGSYIFDKEDFLIRFGVLHMLSFCILFWAVMQKIFPDKIAQAGVALVLAVVVLQLNRIFNNMDYIATQNTILSFLHEKFTVIDGSFSPGDYFPIIPHLGMFLTGAFIGPLLYSRKKTVLPVLEGKWSKPVEFCGRHTLSIMVLHLVIVNGLLALISFLIIGDFIII
jgi:uncharacterized membrane protein